MEKSEKKHWRKIVSCVLRVVPQRNKLAVLSSLKYFFATAFTHKAMWLHKARSEKEKSHSFIIPYRNNKSTFRQCAAALVYVCFALRVNDAMWKEQLKGSVSLNLFTHCLTQSKHSSNLTLCLLCSSPAFFLLFWCLPCPLHSLESLLNQQESSQT